MKRRGSLSSLKMRRDCWENEDSKDWFRIRSIVQARMDKAGNVQTNKEEESMLMNLIQKRYSCRKYVDKPLDRDQIYSCIEAARLAPSACNAQPWMFYVVLDDAKRKELVKLTQPFTKNAGFIIVEEKKPNFSEMIVNKLKDQDFTKTDIGIACSYLTLQAAEAGLATCMIGYFNENKIKELLGIDKKSRLRLVISIGYPDGEEKHRLVRKEIDKVMKIF